MAIQGLAAFIADEVLSLSISFSPFLFVMIIIVLVGIVEHFTHHFYCKPFDIANAFQ